MKGTVCYSSSAIRSANKLFLQDWKNNAIYKSSLEREKEMKEEETAKKLEKQKKIDDADIEEAQRVRMWETKQRVRMWKTK